MHIVDHASVIEPPARESRSFDGDAFHDPIDYIAQRQEQDADMARQAGVYEGADGAGRSINHADLLGDVFRVVFIVLAVIGGGHVAAWVLERL